MAKYLEFGVSFSGRQCRNFGIDEKACLKWLIKDMDFKLFRLMSYWDEIEKQPGKYDFKNLDWQITMIEKAGGQVSLCLGVRQPRWPESHWPDWAWKLPKPQRDDALLRFVETVVKRYKNRKCITSYQLENEALLVGFGERNEVDRKRLKREFQMVKKLDSKRPIIMTTSTSWGIPLRRPIPDIVGFSYYQKLFNAKRQKYTTAFHRPWLDRCRAALIKLIWHKPSFIHELQLEPWGPKNIWEMPLKEQFKSMDCDQIEANIIAAHKTGLSPIYLWGGEWWYWLYLSGKPQIVDCVRAQLSQANR